MVDIKWKVNKCCHQNHFCIPVNIISLPDALNFYISPDTKVLSHFVPLLVSCRPEHFVNSCVLCSPLAQMVQLMFFLEERSGNFELILTINCKYPFLRKLGLGHISLVLKFYFEVKNSELLRSLHKVG